MAADFLLRRSTNKPPIFYGKNYDVWKKMTETFVKSINFDLWYIVVDGFYKILIAKNGKTREKTKKELNENDKRMLVQNIQVMKIFCRVLDKNELKRVKDRKNAQEIWRKLEETYENKYLNFSEEKEECSTSNFNDEENMDDLMIEKIVRSLYEKLRKANELNKTLKYQLNECFYTI